MLRILRRQDWVEETETNVASYTLQLGSWLSSQRVADGLNAVRVMLLRWIFRKRPSISPRNGCNFDRALRVGTEISRARMVVSKATLKLLLAPDILKVSTFRKRYKPSKKQRQHRAQLAIRSQVSKPDATTCTLAGTMPAHKLLDNNFTHGLEYLTDSWGCSGLVDIIVVQRLASKSAVFQQQAFSRCHGVLCTALKPNPARLFPPYMPAISITNASRLQLRAYFGMQEVAPIAFSCASVTISIPLC